MRAIFHSVRRGVRRGRRRASGHAAGRRRGTFALSDRGPDAHARNDSDARELRVAVAPTDLEHRADALTHTDAAAHVNAEADAHADTHAHAYSDADAHSDSDSHPVFRLDQARRRDYSGEPLVQ